MVGRRKVVRVVLESAEEGSRDWYVATSPDLPGIVTQGKGIDETVANVREALSAFFDGKPPAHNLDIRVMVPV